MILNEQQRNPINLPFGFDSLSLRRSLLIVVVALAGGVLTSVLGLLTLPLAGVVLLCSLLVLIGYRLWWRLLVSLLLGYLFFSKGFATLGFFPVYIGEVMMGIGILTLLLSPFISTIKVRIRPFLHWEIGVLVLFLIWQLAQTIPYFRIYEFNTLRDAMLYGYAAFAFLIMLMTPKKDVQHLFDLFGRLLPIMLLWYPVLFIMSRTNAVPFVFPGAPNPIIFTKGSDLGVHIAGAGAYLLLQLYRGNNPRWLTWATWALWSANVVLIGAMGRGVMVAAAGSAAIVVLLHPLRSHWYRPLLLGTLVICVLILTGLYSTLKIDIGANRVVSTEQLVDNVVSIFGEGDNDAGGLEGTKQWRLLWWNTIVEYTVHGHYFWTGKGYGINLADSDGFQVTADSSLRSPHNAHMTILARSGVPGFVLWAVFLGGLALRLALIAVRYDHDPTRARYALWLLAYLVAFGIIGGLDVFLESPMGGIWFWALIGLTYVYLTPDKVADPAVSPAKGRNHAYRPV